MDDTVLSVPAAWIDFTSGSLLCKKRRILLCEIYFLVHNYSSYFKQCMLLNLINNYSYYFKECILLSQQYVNLLL
jgi:hypothetical protein